MRVRFWDVLVLLGCIVTAIYLFSRHDWYVAVPVTVLVVVLMFLMWRDFNRINRGK